MVVAGSSLGICSASRTLLASLIVHSGGSFGSLIIREMLTSLGLKKTFAIYSAIDAFFLVIAIAMLKERRRPEARKQIIWFDKTNFRDPVFWSLGACFFFTVL